MNPRLLLHRLCRLAGENKLFSWALLAGALLRLDAMLGYPGALWFSGDSYVYVGAALRPQPNLSKAVGYSFFLRLLLPFHSFTLVTGVQHLMGLLTAVMIYVLLRRNKVSRTWAAIATLPQLLDGYIIEDEHLIMAETLFTFLLMIATLLLLWKPRPAWWTALVAGLLVGAAAMVRTEGEVMLAVLPLFLLLRGWSWKRLHGWAVAIVFTVAALVPVGAYMNWFHEHTGHYNTTMSMGFYTWGRMSSFANCAVIKPAGEAAKVCPTQPIADRTPPGNYIWYAPYVHQNLNSVGGPVSPKGNQILTSFAISAVGAQPFDYAKTVVRGVMLSFGFPRIGYPGSGTTYYYNFHAHYTGTNAATGKLISLLPPDNPKHEWVHGGTAYSDWLSYGHQAPGVVRKAFAAPIAIYQRVVFTYGPLLAVIFLIGLGGLFSLTARGRGTGFSSLVSAGPLRSVRLRWRPRGTSMLPWATAVALLVAPTAVADFDYRYLIPVIPFAAMAAGLSFAPRKDAAEEVTAGGGTVSRGTVSRGTVSGVTTGEATAGQDSPAEIESTVPDSVA
ncbi:MAG: phospholipid carrier-dependent glycosyltransferase [Trebonia sp.]